MRRLPSWRALSLPTAALARDRIKIVGSITVFPYTQAVAEEFTNATKFKAPVVALTGTGGGMKLLCEGVGEDSHLDEQIFDHALI